MIAAPIPNTVLARARDICVADFEWPIGFSWPSGAVPVVSCQGSPRRARFTSQTPDNPEDGDQERRRLDSREQRIAGELRTHDRDREHEDHEQSLEAQDERGRPRRERASLPIEMSRTTSTTVWIAIPPRMFPIAIPRLCEQRGRDDDGDLREVRRDCQQDRAAERLAQAEPRVEHVRRAREVDARDPDRAGSHGEDQDERDETQAGEHAGSLRFGA